MRANLGRIENSKKLGWTSYRESTAVKAMADQVGLVGGPPRYAWPSPPVGAPPPGKSPRHPQAAKPPAPAHGDPAKPASLAAKAAGGPPADSWTREPPLHPFHPVLPPPHTDWSVMRSLKPRPPPGAAASMRTPGPVGFPPITGRHMPRSVGAAGAFADERTPLPGCVRVRTPVNSGSPRTSRYV